MIANRFRHSLFCLLVLAGVLAAPASASNALQGEPPARAGRVSDLQGPVSLYDTETGQWDEALRNRAVTEGDRLSTGPSGRAEVRIGSTELRLGGGAEIEFIRLDDARMVLQVWRGSLAVRVRSREIASELEVVTREGRFQPERAGHYRIDREDDTTAASAWRGSLRVQAGMENFEVSAGRRVEVSLTREGAAAVAWSGTVTDAFADAVARDEQRDERSVSHRYVSPEMTGVEDLDRHGRWERHPEFGMVWSPLVVAAGWAPFRHGRWVWHVRWGWTWVDAAPWGFAPFHYGRWVLWGTRWVWTPGVWTPRPAFAPALVTWGTAPGVSVSVTFTNRYSPPVVWNPLPPRQAYVPVYPQRPPHPRPPVREPISAGHEVRPAVPYAAALPSPVVPSTAVVPAVPPVLSRPAPALASVPTPTSAPVQASSYGRPAPSQAGSVSVPPAPMVNPVPSARPSPALEARPDGRPNFHREAHPRGREGREAREAANPRDARDARDGRDPRDGRPPQEKRDQRDQRDQRESRQEREEGVAQARRGEAPAGRARDAEHRPRDARERQQLL